MRYIPDRTGRFPVRPHFVPDELDRECETVVTNLLTELHAKVAFPISTDDITKLIERDTKDLDLYADLSEYGSDVEGVTEFERGAKPRVAIASELSADARYSNRLRTTLTHEYGHVRFHAPLWELERPDLPLIDTSPHPGKVVCKRDAIVDTRQSDWMEWQAGYVCGAILMPKTHVMSACRQFSEDRGLFGGVWVESTAGEDLCRVIQELFEVSGQAARVRLLKLGLLTRDRPSASLF